MWDHAGQNAAMSEQTKLLYQNCQSEEVNVPEIMPIYPSTAYCMRDTADYIAANTGEKYLYNRSGNPNRSSLAQTISQLEHGADSLICASGMSAISTALLGLLRAGDHIVVNQTIYGETIELLETVLSRYGIYVTFADFTLPETVRSAICDQTVLLYTEVIANPLTYVTDIKKIAEIAHSAGALLAVDSTFTTPILIKPLDLGADLVLHSLTKYFGGHSDVTGGSITASQALIERIRPTYTLLGGCLDATSAWMISRSIQTMAMRVDRQNQNATELAERLSRHPKVLQVYHPSLLAHPQHQLAQQMFSGSYGAIVSFRLEDNLERVNTFIHRLKLVQYLGTLGGIRTSITHPMTAFQDAFSPETLQEMGLSSGLIRVSVGAEDIADIWADFSQALDR